MPVITKLARREFLHLATKYSPEKPPRGGYSLGGWYLSTKLDGQRAFFDGGLTRGMRTVDVPWANIYDPKKPGELKKKIRPTATGLWSRYGNPIQAPEWFLNGLPSVPLDGELFAGRGKFQQAMSAVRKDIPIDSEWEGIEFAAYSSPAFELVFADGEIKNTNFHRKINCGQIHYWLETKASNIFGDDFKRCPAKATFEDEVAFLNESLAGCTDFAYAHKQIKLSLDHEEAAQQIEEYYNAEIQLGGEGVIIRDSLAQWLPKRVSSMLKYTPENTDEATIVGFTSGRKTEKGSKLLGMIGSLITVYSGKRLELAGLTDEERQFSKSSEKDYAKENPDSDMPSNFQGTHFKVGDTISFVYRELSDMGIPKSARYYRKRNEK